jgi:uncharacterized membrane protein
VFRVELFSDAVFAVAITLTAVNLPVVNQPGSLIATFADRWASFASFGISFFLLGSLWMGHFQLMRLVSRVDGLLLLANLGLLLVCVLVPFGTSVMATFVPRGGVDAQGAAALYSGIIGLFATMFTALRWHVLRLGGFIVPTPHTVREWLVWFRPYVAMPVGAAGIGLAFASPIATLCLTAATSVMYLVAAVLNLRPSTSG